MGMFGKMFGNKDKDQLVLDALKKEGSNLSKPHSIDFWFDFEKEEGAHKVAEILSGKGFEVEVLKNESSPYFSCRAIKTMIPEINKMRSITQEFEALAEQANGNYDGWGTEIVI